MERERIARELHDTLLQGFLSASMQLHVANNRLPAESPAKSLIVGVLDLMGQVIKDGRNAVRGLRLPGLDSDDLEQAFSRLPKELAVPQTVDFRVMVEGQARPLHPAIRDELYQIGREALANAVRHSQASAIEVELEYSDGQLRVVVRDNGCGVDEQILRSGREGHWGLSGMRERAGKPADGVRRLRPGSGWNGNRIIRAEPYRFPISLREWLAALASSISSGKGTARKPEGWKRTTAMNDDARIRVLCVDDHPLLRAGIGAVINDEADMLVVAQASNADEAIQQFRQTDVSVGTGIPLR